MHNTLYGDGKCNRQWLADALYHRFFHIPDNVTIWLEKGTHTRGDEKRRFQTIPMRIGQYGRSETVTTDSGIKLHYTFDPDSKYDSGHNISISGAMASTPTHAAVVYRGEMYDVRRSNRWSAVAPEFGISFGSRHILVHVELPDDYNVVPEGYRRFIQLSDGDKHQVYVTEFASIVRDHRPEWLVEIIKSFGPKPSVDASSIERELQDLLNSLAVRTTGPRANLEGDLRIREGSGRGEGPTTNSTNNPNPNPGQASKPTRYQETLEGVRRATSAAMRETAPKIVLLDDDEQIEERELVNRCACFLPGENELCVNTKYRAIEEIANYLETTFAYARDELGEAVSETAKKIATNIATIRAGRAVVHAKAKSILYPQTWDDEAIMSACRPECLSVIVDDWADAAEHAQKEMRKSLGISSRQARASRQAA